MAAPRGAGVRYEPPTPPLSCWRRRRIAFTRQGASAKAPSRARGATKPRMLATSMPRKPAPMLAMWAVGARGRVGPTAFGNAVGSSLASAVNSPSYSGGQPVSSIGIEPLTPTPIQVDMSGVLPGALNVASDYGADPMPNGSIDSILRREGVNDGSPYTWGKVSGNVSRTEGGDTTQIGEFGVLNGISNLDKVSGTAWYKLPIAGTYDTASADAAYQAQAVSWKDAADSQMQREINREQSASRANSEASVSDATAVAMLAIALQKPAGLGDPGVDYDPAYLARFNSGPQLMPYDANAAAAQAAQQQRDANTLGMWGGGLLAVGAFAGRAMHVDENSVSNLGIASAGLLMSYEGMPPIDSVALSPVPVAGNVGGNWDVVATAQSRQQTMLQDNVGFNISPTAWDQYPTIGRAGTFVSDRLGTMDYFGDVGGASEITIGSNLASQIESDMGLVPGTLQDGFKVRQITGIRDLEPVSPMEGNQYFQGPGNHLPSGAPELVVKSISTVDTSNVTTVLKVKVGP